VPKRLRYPEKKPVLKKRPVTEPKQQPKPPIQTLVKNPSINVDEFSAPAAPIKQNIVSVFWFKNLNSSGSNNQFLFSNFILQIQNSCLFCETRISPISECQVFLNS
jgi:hypothetical protein